MKRMACVIALASSAGLAAAAPSALAEPMPVLMTSGMQIAVASNGTVSAEGTVNLDVTFRGGSPHSIELFIDGERIKRKSIFTHDTHGTITFALDGGLLARGDHEILIKATELDGSSATATTTLHIGSETAGLAEFLFPKNHAQVQGVLPIEIKLDGSIKTPYVSFYIDNDFLAMTNFAPFTYNWDTSRIPNGKHTIAVDVFDGDTASLVKKLSMQVNVNNPGGFTNLQKEIPNLDASQPNSIGKILPQVARGVGESASPRQHFTPNAPHQDGLTSRLTFGPHLNTRAAHPNMDSSPAPRATYPAMAVPFLDVVRPNLGILRPDSAIRTIAPEKRSAFAAPDAALPARQKFVPTVAGMSIQALLANPDTYLKPTRMAGGGMAHVGLRPRRAGNLAVRPSMVLGGMSAVAAAPAFVTSHPVTFVKSPLHHFIGLGAFKGKARSFQVAFDNSRIAFDVAPRVEHGLPLAPFRQIFEHTGGQVAWYGQSKTVRAVNSSREIEFRVGDRQAKVNNQPLTMEATPYIEKGRAIVPLSFVRDALNVTVQYDPVSGHMLIESKK